MRWAISSGCSIKLVFDSMTPGISTLPSGNFTSWKTFHSCAWRGLAASKERPHGLGYGEKKVFFARVVSVVKEQRDYSRRGGAEEGFLCVHSSKRHTKIGDICLGRLGIPHTDRAIAAGSPAPRTPGIAKNPPR